jgi:hypothetical protein
MSIIDGDSLVSWSSFLHTSTCQLIMLRLFSRGNNFTFVEFERNWYKHSTLWTDDKKMKVEHMQRACMQTNMLNIWNRK